MADEYQRRTGDEWKKFTEAEQSQEIIRLRRSLSMWQGLAVLLLVTTLALSFLMSKVHEKAPIQDWLPEAIGIGKK